MKKALAMVLALSMSLGLITGCTASNTGSQASGEASKATSEAASTAAEESSSPEDLKQATAELSLYTYYVDSDKEIIDYALAEMKKIFPNVTVVPENRTDADGTVLKTRAAVGELPDIFECPSNVLESFSQSGDIAPLDDAMKAVDFASYVLPSVLENRASKDGKIYAISALANEPYCLFYNKEVFAKYNLTEPKNFDEFKNVVKTLNDNGVIPLSIFAQEKWPGLQLFDLAVVANNPLGIAALETGEAKATDPAFTEAAKKLSELVSMGIIGKGAFSTNASQAFEQFRLGQAGMLTNGVWYFGDAKEYGDSIGYLSYNPFADAGKEDQVRFNLSGGKMSPGGYAVNANSENAQLAAQFMLYFNIERAKAKTILNGAVSALTEDVQPKEPRYESYQQFADNVSKVTNYSTFNWSLENAEIKTALEDGVEMLMAGNYSADDFIKNLDAQVAAAAP